MSVLVDTSVWSEFLGRPSGRPHVVQALRQLVEAGEVAMIGAIRQEILSGLKERRQFDRLKKALGAFVDEQTRSEDYENAAEFFKRCRAVGVQGSNTDFLICSVAELRGLPIFTLDRDFEVFARHLPIQLFEP